MALQCGIVGLPNVGKSTLFNALTKAGIAAENYPFCTIEPNVGVVEVPDFRLGKLACPLKNKNALSALLKGHCAQDWIRTSTSLRTLRPEHSASTNFATWAVEGKYTPERHIKCYFNMNLTFTFILILIFSKSI